MTDDDVTREIAEFMGWTRRTSDDDGATCKPYWERDDGVITREEFGYLTSYDALAPVWRKLWETRDDGRHKAAMDSMCGCFPPNAPARMYPPSAFWVSPRDHAHAIARALREAKAAKAN